jgi:excisionase family DNA binding protein
VSDELLTTAQVADLFKVSQLTVRRWCSTGVLPAIKFGHEWRISKDRLDRLIQERISRRIDSQDSGDSDIPDSAA